MLPAKYQKACPLLVYPLCQTRIATVGLLTEGRYTTALQWNLPRTTSCLDREQLEP